MKHATAFFGLCAALAAGWTSATEANAPAAATLKARTWAFAERPLALAADGAGGFWAALPGPGAGNVLHLLPSGDGFEPGERFDVPSVSGLGVLDTLQGRQLVVRVPGGVRRLGIDPEAWLVRTAAPLPVPGRSPHPSLTQDGRLLFTEPGRLWVGLGDRVLDLSLAAPSSRIEGGILRVTTPDVVPAHGLAAALTPMPMQRADGVLLQRVEADGTGLVEKPVILGEHRVAQQWQRTETTDWLLLGDARQIDVFGNAPLRCIPDAGVPADLKTSVHVWHGALLRARSQDRVDLFSVQGLLNADLVVETAERTPKGFRLLPARNVSAGDVLRDWLAAADLDGDGAPDVALRAPGGLRIFLRNPQGGFSRDARTIDLAFLAEEKGVKLSVRDESGWAALDRFPLEPTGVPGREILWGFRPDPSGPGGTLVSVTLEDAP